MCPFILGAVDSSLCVEYNPSIETMGVGKSMKVNHNSLAYKMRAQPYKAYKGFATKAKGADFGLDVPGYLRVLHRTRENAGG